MNMQRRRPLLTARRREAAALLATMLLASGCTAGGCGKNADAGAPARGEASAREASSTAPPQGSIAAAPAALGASLDERSEPSARPLASASPSGSAAIAPAEPGSCPPEMASVGSYCIDRHEAHLMTEAGGEFTAHPHFMRPQRGVRYFARSEASVFPQAYISRVEAKAACVAAGKRLCSLREWQRACRSKGVEKYPYGPKGERGRCNTAKIHLLRRFFGAHPPGGWSYETHFNDPGLDQLPGFLARTGEFDRCVTERGVFDMLGNLHEWVSDSVDQDFVDQLNQDGVERNRQPWREGNGVFMGGFFSTTSELGPGCYYTTIAHEPTYHDYSTGFRCCASPAPSGAQAPEVKADHDGH